MDSAGDCLALEKLLKFLKMIDFGHTLFGLPFAYLGAFWLSWGPHSEPAGVDYLAMISARTSALCLNRIIDRHLDRANPRTAHWVMASGQLPGFGWGTVLIGFTAFPGGFPAQPFMPAISPAGGGGSMGLFLYQTLYLVVPYHTWSGDWDGTGRCMDCHNRAFGLAAHTVESGCSLLGGRF